MNHQYVLTTKNFLDSELEELLATGISDYSTLSKKMTPTQGFSILLKEKEGKILGGATGVSLYGCLYTDMLWVEPSLRGQGWGKKLMCEAEMIGKRRGCSFATVDTMDFQALPFYQQLSYDIEFIRDGFENDSKMYFLRKSLTLDR